MNKELKDTFIKKARNVHGDKFNYDKVIYKNNNFKVEIVCPIHGSFWQIPRSHTLGIGCRDCGNIRMGNGNRNTLETIKERGNKKFNNKYKYLKFTYIPETKRSFVKFICPDHGIQRQRVHTHLSRNSVGCPICARAVVGNKNSTGTEEFIRRAVKTHGDRYDYSKTVYTTIETNVIITCREHGDFTQNPKWHATHGGGCPICKSSNGEKMISSFLVAEGIKHTKEKAVKIGNSFYRFDFYIDDIKLFIEFDGKQHFMPIKYFGGVKTFNGIKKRDKIKNAWIKKNRFNLLRISYKDIKKVNEILINTLSKFYMYKVGGVYYKTFLELRKCLGKPLT